MGTPPRQAEKGRNAVSVGVGALAPEQPAVRNVGGQASRGFSGEASQPISKTGPTHEVTFQDLEAEAQHFMDQLETE